MDETRERSGRGFAGMDAQKQKEIASKGGRAAHEKGTAHEFDSSEARAAGRKGGLSVSQNREHMAAIGRHGGQARGARAQAQRAAAAQNEQAGTQGAGSSQHSEGRPSASMGDTSLGS